MLLEEKNKIAARRESIFNTDSGPVILQQPANPAPASQSRPPFTAQSAATPAAPAPPQPPPVA
ncbi:hypothetical protein Dda_5525 [Drechslerella dactyloides]|uniref:Uncharacterized protein n=1 Tax=Drechslerella dactyloides TaxID=74499 RepID=A0AAD6IWP2_DREDA|nr:hypothetical protein Dda_5525 [Drechslerella dactyloides]